MSSIWKERLHLPKCEDKDAQRATLFPHLLTLSNKKVLKFDVNDYDLKHTTNGQKQTNYKHLAIRQKDVKHCSLYGLPRKTQKIHGSKFDPGNKQKFSAELKPGMCIVHVPGLCTYLNTAVFRWWLVWYAINSMLANSKQIFQEMVRAPK